jgi:hypothetical protein
MFGSKSRVVVIVLLILSAIIAFNGFFSDISSRIITRGLREQNDKYLNSAFEKTLAGFGVMSVLKASLAVIEGSSGGASMGFSIEIQLGDVVQSIYDYVDIAWRTLLTGCVTIKGIQYLLKAADLAGPYSMGALFLLLALFLSLRWWKSNWVQFGGVVRDLLSVAIVVFIMLHYILPLSVWGTSQLSGVITSSEIEEAHKGFVETRKDFYTGEENILSEPQKTIEKIRNLPGLIAKKSKDISVWTIKLITGYTLDCIIFPMMLFTFLLWLTRSVINYIFQRNLQTTMYEDIRKLLIEGRIPDLKKTDEVISEVAES